MTYTITLPKIIYLTLFISKYAKKQKYYNTNDLIKIANEMKPELIRMRKDKKDYKFLDDTKFGGLRGNFSTALTFIGFVKQGSAYTPYYSLGDADKLFNACIKGEIILDTQEYCAYTKNENLKNMLEKEARIFNIRETQAHIKKYIEKHPAFPLRRDDINFPKIAVLKSQKDQYFLRILLNTFKTENIVEFNMFNYLQGTKIKSYNIHPLFVVPTFDNPWEDFYVIDSKEIFENTPLFIYFDRQTKKFYDNNNHVYTSYSLNEGLEILSAQNENIEERLNYNWKKTRENLISDYIERKSKVEQDEFAQFLKNFLHWQRNFSIYGKDVIDIDVSSSGGPDVTLTFSGGTTQKVELEHKWNNYILHKHYIDQAWQDVWLYADEKWDFSKVAKIFSPHLSEHIDRIPKVFLCPDPETGAKKAYEVNWDNLTFKEIDIRD